MRSFVSLLFVGLLVMAAGCDKAPEPIPAPVEEKEGGSIQSSSPTKETTPSTTSPTTGSETPGTTTPKETTTTGTPKTE
jgi:hypothetical protein